MAALVGGLLAAVIALVVALVVVTGEDEPDPGTTTSAPPSPTSAEPSPTPPAPTESTIPETQDLSARRAEVAEPAREFILRVNTYGPELLADDGTMPSYRSEVGALLTPAFRRSFEQGVGVAERAVAAGAASTARVDVTGVGALGESTAEVLVAGRSQQAMDGSARERGPFRFVVTLAASDGGWLVDDFTPAQAGGPGLAPGTDELVEPAVGDAQTAAAAALPAIISYDYRSLDEDVARALPLLTDDYGETFEQNFSVLREPAVRQRTVVRARSLAAGVVTAAADRVEVLVFVDRPTTSGDSEPRVLRDQVTVTVRIVGDTWLVDGLVSGS